MQKITCVGYHDTGSGAVDDFFREFNCFNKGLADMECRILQDPDGISDLEYNLVENPHRLNSGFALKRFRIMLTRYYRLYSRIFGSEWLKTTDDYIDSLTKIKYKGYWHADTLLMNPIRRFVYQVRRKLNKMLPKKLQKSNWYNYFPTIDAHHTQISEEEFLQKTRDYIDNLCNNLSAEDSRYVVLDQLVHPNNIPRYLRYVNDLKVIVVDRDPRDIYIEQINFEEHTLPKDVNEFCTVYRDIRKQTNTDESGSVLQIKFEDLIYNYDDCTKEIMKFVGLDESERVCPRKYFNPDRSIKNTKLWEKYPQFAEAVKIIERELPEFLYQYE